MYSINKPQGLIIYVPRLKCQPLPWKGSLLVVGKTEQRAARAGQEQRGKESEAFPGTAKSWLQKAAWQRAFQPVLLELCGLGQVISAVKPQFL